jgi:hypothetical protein
MAGQLAGQQEDGIDADVVARPGEARGQPLGGDGDSPQPVGIERHGGAIFAGPRLDFDEGDNAPAAGDQVDLAAGDARPLGEDAPAVQPKPPGRQPFGLTPAPLGKLAPAQRLSSSARA